MLAVQACQCKSVILASQALTYACQASIMLVGYSTMADEKGVAEYAAQGGRARATSLTREQRREIARTAAATRWSNQGYASPIQAMYGAPERPLRDRKS